MAWMYPNPREDGDWRSPLNPPLRIDNPIHRNAPRGSGWYRYFNEEEPRGRDAMRRKPWGQRPMVGKLPLGLQWYQFNSETGKKEYGPFARGLLSGAASLGDLMSNPGGFQPNLSQAIAPRLAMESEMISRNTMGQQANAAGAAARSGTAGSGFSQALSASIQQAGARQQSDSLRQAQVDSAQLYRQDLDRVMEAYQMLLNWYKPGNRGNSGSSRDRTQPDYGGIASGVGSIIGGIASFSDKRLKKNIKPVSWEWNGLAESVGKVAGTREEGLLAQDVERVWPDAVGERSGFKTVDYQKVATRLASIVNQLEKAAA